MNRKEKRDWLQRRYDGNWVTVVDPGALFDAIYDASPPKRVAETLRSLISKHSDSAGRVVDPAGLMKELRSVADAMGAR